MTRLEKLITRLHDEPENVEFGEVIEVIEEYYSYTPTGFTNGPEDVAIFNAPGENEGSCKIFSFAKIHHLDEMQTLHCFGQYYRNDVLQNPDDADHGNIRTFIKHGWDNIIFEADALKIK